MINDFKIHHFHEVGSTQTVAKEMIAKGDVSHGDVITATILKQGYGKHNRRWYSEEGDFILTAILKPEVEVDLWSQICFVFAVSMGESLISKFPNIVLNYKWVNDILINYKKACGILLEKVTDDFLIAGIALNIVTRDENNKNIEQPYTSLANNGIEITASELQKLFLSNLKKYYNHWQQHGFTPTKNLWLKRAYKMNELVEVKGEQNLKGIMIGVDDKGNLLLEQNNSVTHVSAGDLFF